MDPVCGLGSGKVQHHSGFSFLAPIDSTLRLFFLDSPAFLSSAQQITPLCFTRNAYSDDAVIFLLPDRFCLSGLSS